ncbi:MAG: 30S ribosomal protein S12 methylthiotransferase RimO [Lachnospiraceae bacterium]|nr:30S ribosomal protein S12 methylthiotransferase RimO [Lachnospiraceae bacterium]
MKIMMISLGCDKNRVDSESMLGLAVTGGHGLTDDENEADAIIINTCCFIHDAKEESINSILECAELKKTGHLKKLIVTGCLAQRYADDITKEIPEVDAILGTTAYDELLDVLDDTGLSVRMKDISAPLHLKVNRVITGENYVSYLKIAEGCDKHCTYCVIPSVRGNFRSFPMEDLVSEAKYLAENGTRELVLVAQETTVYGTDLYGEKSLHLLIRKLAEIPELKWIRLMYCYPEEIYPELIETMAECEKVVHYLDIPVQHSSDTVLKRMGRRTTRKEILGKIKALRKRIPDIALRTSLIVGFPGETEEDVEDLLDFIKEAKFTRLGCFTYSREEGTPAAKMADQIKAAEKRKRRSKVMKLAGEISKENGKNMCGKTLPVIIEGYLADEDIYVGRTYMDAPGVDGMIFVFSDENLLSGDIIDVLVTGAKKYDLYGEATVNESAE